MRKTKSSRWTRYRRERGMQLLELALALPMLLVLSAGVMDFAQAWTLRQVLANAAREGARYQASQTDLLLSNTPPSSIVQTCRIVADYLQQANVNLTFMNNTTSSGSGSTTVSGMCADPGTVASSSCTAALTGGTCFPEAWTYYGTGYGSTGSYGLKIEPLTISAGTLGTATRVTLTYPYNWGMGFENIVRFFGPSTYSATVPIPVYSTMLNLAN